MIIQLKWLNELVELKGISLEDITNKLSLYSTEVEKAGSLIKASNIFVGYVKTKAAHPNSDHLSVVMVDVGGKEALQIVCGAPNIEAGQYVIVALEGAILPGDFVIKKTKIRGVESNGMVCSLQELGINKKFIDDKYLDGIYYFEEEKPVGMKGDLALGLDTKVIEIDVMPNRGDLLSMIGLAYEFSALFNRPLKALPKISYKVCPAEEFSLKLDNNLCSSYYAQIIRSVTIKDSPQWLKARLIAFDVRPINNVVDITNYILALFGQPLHAFDYDLLGKEVLVRNAKEGELLVTLDKQERKLLTSDLVITNGKAPVALAGVMGGLDTEVTLNTKNILLEAACFDPLTIRKTSTRLGLRSESSLRFERGVNLNRTKEALLYANQLLVELADAKIIGEAVHAGIEKLEDRLISLSQDKINSVLGIKIKTVVVEKILTSLGFKYELDKKNFTVYVPNRRSDINIVEDLIEEVARLYGYDKIPLSLPQDAMLGELKPQQQLRRKIKTTLASLGLNEALTYSLVSSKEITDCNLKLLMPISEEHSTMRTSLIPSLVEVLKYNYSRKNEDLAFFELSKIYYKEADEIKELEVLAGAVSNRYSHSLWQGKIEKVDFFLLKGILNRLFQELKISATYLPLEKNDPMLHPKRSAKITVNGLDLGYLGQLHPKYLQENDLDEVYVFELILNPILNQEIKITNFKAPSKLPSISRDLALVLNKDILASEVVEAVYKVDKNLISSVEVFDLYLGEGLALDEKSLAISIVFTSNEPLTDEVINQRTQKIVKDLSFRFKARLR